MQVHQQQQQSADQLKRGWPPFEWPHRLSGELDANFLLQAEELCVFRQSLKRERKRSKSGQTKSNMDEKKEGKRVAA